MLFAGSFPALQRTACTPASLYSLPPWEHPWTETGIKQPWNPCL